MKIGVPKEIKIHEYRVGLVPAGVRELVDAAHAQATAKLPVELEHIVKERRRVDAAVRRRLARGEPVDGRSGGRPDGDDDPLGTFAREIGPALERLGAEIEKIFGTADREGRTGGQADGRTEGEARGADRPPADPSVRSEESLLERRDRLDRELRRGLEQLGVVVTGADVARAVGAAVGKRIEWTG